MPLFVKLLNFLCAPGIFSISIFKVAIFKVGIYCSIKLILIQTNYQKTYCIQSRKNNVFNQRHILQVYLSAVQSLILCFKRDNVGSCLILSSRVLHRKLSRKDNESSPKPNVFIVTSFVSLDCKSCVSFHKISIQVKGSWTFKFLSSVFCKFFICIQLLPLRGSNVSNCKTFGGDIDLQLTIPEILFSHF